MGKKNDDDVRDHNQERDWLLKLGHGNLVDGVDQLLQQLANSKNAPDYLKNVKIDSRRK